MTRIARTVLPFLLVIATGCQQDPKSFRITEANRENFLDQIKDREGLTVEESGLLYAYIMRTTLATALGGDRPQIVGKTVGDLIAEQRVFQKSEKKRDEEGKRLAAEAKAREDTLAAELRKAINLTVYAKDFRGSNPMAGEYNDYIIIRCVYQNTSGRPIRAFKGNVVFTDLFGKEIFQSALTIADPIPADAKQNWTGTIEYNQFRDQHRALRSAELANMKVVWTPQSVIFADGTQIPATQ